jgi:hypothetical protein
MRPEAPPAAAMPVSAPEARLPEATVAESSSSTGAPWEPHATAPAPADPVLPAFDRLGLHAEPEAGAAAGEGEAPPPFLGEVTARALESASTVERWTTPPTSLEQAGEPKAATDEPAAQSAAHDASAEKVGLYDDGGADYSETTAPPRAEDVISANVTSEPVIDVAPQPEEERMPPAVASLQDTMTHEVARHSHQGERAIYAMESAEEWAPSGESATRAGAAGAGEQAARTLESLARRLRRGEVGIGEVPSSAGEAAVLAAVLAALLARRT